MYIRELPVEVHTKFIEENKGVLKNLLDYLLPEGMVHTGETDFEKRFGLNRTPRWIIKCKYPPGATPSRR